MTKIDIFSGFLGAGKTTLIKKLIEEAYGGEKVVLIENEFGEIGIDGGFLEDAGIEITEMNSGCICCSLVGDFSKALKQVLKEYSPDRIIIEPSGVGKLSDIIKAVQSTGAADMELNSFTTVADVNKCKMYVENFGEFYKDQIEHANCIVLSHTTNASDEKVKSCVELLRTMNKDATIITTPWEKLTGKQITGAMEKLDTLEKELQRLEEEDECPVCHHHHHDGECHHEHEHEHHHHEHEHEHEHEHHHDHEHEHEHEHEHHHHEHHHHDHDHEDGHHHHHADEVFTSWGVETTNKYSTAQIQSILEGFGDTSAFGTVLRAKGIVESDTGEWIHFDYVPGEVDVRRGAAAVIGRLCVIGAKINEENIKKAFNID